MRCNSAPGFVLQLSILTITSFTYKVLSVELMLSIGRLKLPHTIISFNLNKLKMFIAGRNEIRKSYEVSCYAETKKSSTTVFE